jgi:hypothetical protein
VWGSTWAAFFAALWLARTRPVWAPRAAALLVAFATLAALARDARRLPPPYHRVGYPEVAAALAPRLAGLPPGRRTLLAPEAPAFGYYLFRTCGYWGTPITPWTTERREELFADTTLRAFVVDPGREWYGGWPDSTTLGWLERSTREITAQIGRRDGRALGLRVFVRGL